MILIIDLISRVTNDGSIFKAFFDHINFMSGRLLTRVKEQNSLKTLTPVNLFPSSIIKAFHCHMQSLMDKVTPVDCTGQMILFFEWLKG